MALVLAAISKKLGVASLVVALLIIVVSKGSIAQAIGAGFGLWAVGDWLARKQWIRASIIWMAAGGALSVGVHLFS